MIVRSAACNEVINGPGVYWVAGARGPMCAMILAGDLFYDCMAESFGVLCFWMGIVFS